MIVSPGLCNVLYYKPVWGLAARRGPKASSSLLNYLWLGTTLASFAAGSLLAQAPAAGRLWPNLADNIERPLRYRPDSGDFVIENGTEFFNRPLYGGNTAFRVDGGDKPEFVLYLPGRGGNLRLGLHSAAGVRWLHEATQITTRYRPGELLYEIRDPLLGPGGVLRLAVLAWHQAEGLVVRAEGDNLAPSLELVWAYGGINGQRGARDGDIGTERVPISEWFRLQPEFCRDNRIELGGGAFTVRAPLPRDQSATIHGLVPADSRLTVGDATQWNDLPALLDSVGSPLVGGPDQARRQAPALQIVVGRAPLANGTPLYFSFQRLATDVTPADLDTYRAVTAPRVGRADPGTPVAKKRAEVYPPAASPKATKVSAIHREDLPGLFAATEAHFAALRGRVAVETPDPWLNAAVGALNVAADAVWDEPQQAIMHGAIAWRTKLLGWRGPYALDALGWTDRARANLTYWAGRQNTDPIPEKLPPPDAGANLARSETALHSNGDISNSHYDMNTVFIDGLFRHLLWTGDVAFAKQLWPVIERHLAWERRLFRREFGPEKLPLYEAYAVIWASDDLQYSGGGTTHASAYNYWHNQMAARLAPLAGADPAPYTREAGLIARALQELLWTGDHYAEAKDLLGRQLVHPSPGLWTFYHAADSGVPGFGRMADHMLKRLRIPVRGPGVPADADYGLLPTTDWLPYTWSLNNVVMAENVHTALALWQSDRSDAAFRLLKSSLLASMFMGISPGNVGSMNYLDVYRRESQRDFADGSGVLSRAVVEGLFGVRPDALAGELTLAPGWPADWAYARLNHPRVGLEYRREGIEERLVITPRFARAMALRLQLPRRGETATITINGTETPAEAVGDDTPSLVVLAVPAEKYEVVISWRGKPPPDRPYGIPVCGMPPLPPCNPETVAMDPVPLMSHFNDRVTEIFRPGKYLSPRSPFVSLALPSQGIGYWAGHVNATAEIDDTGLRAAAGAHGGRIVLPNGVPFATPGPGEAKNILFTSQWDNYPREATAPLTGKAHRLHLLMAGSTNAMQSRLDNGEVVVTYADGSTSRMALRNPETWWPIEQDYFTDDYQFRIDGSLPVRVDLKTGLIRVLEPVAFKGQGRTIPGGAATVLELPLNPTKELRSITVRALANDVVIGLMAATLAR